MILEQKQNNNKKIFFFFLFPFIRLEDPYSMKKLDKLMAKLDQDNKKLAELDQKVRTTANLSYNLLNKQPTLSSSLQQTMSSLLGNTNQQMHSSLPSLNNTIGTNLLNLSSLTSKNPLSSALETTNINPVDLGYSNFNNPLASSSTNTVGLMNSLGLLNLNSIQSNLNTRQTLSQPTLTGLSALNVDIAAQQKQLQNQIQQIQQQQQKLLDSTLNSRQQQSQPPPSQHHRQNPITTAINPTPTHQISNEIRIVEDIVDSIEIANRGRFRVFIARYSYDPFKQSPNEHPEAELHLNAGDFLLVQGDMDEDGFYFGEHLDGRKGLVPCNFVEKLQGDGWFQYLKILIFRTKLVQKTVLRKP